MQAVGNTVKVTGGSDVGVLYGAYAMAEKLGVWFYLQGDIVPDFKAPFFIPSLDETSAPGFTVPATRLGSTAG